MSEINRTKLPGFPLGVISNLNNQAEFPEQALANGENVKLTNGVSTRGGTSITSSGSLPSGEVVFAKQVRFPTNETSYMLVQVNSIPPDNTIPDPTPAVWSDPYPGQFAEHQLAYDSKRNIFVVCGIKRSSGIANQVYFYDPTTDAWTYETISCPTERWATSMVYDPVGDRMIVTLGKLSDYSDAAGTIAFDCETHTWSTLTTTGDAPELPSDYPYLAYNDWEIWGSAYCAERNSMVLFAVSTEGRTELTVTIGETEWTWRLGYSNVYELDLDTLVWTRHPVLDIPTLLNTTLSSGSATYNADEDAFYVFGGLGGYFLDSNTVDAQYYKTCFKYSFATSTWSQLTDMPYPVKLNQCFSTGGKVYFYGGFRIVNMVQYLLHNPPLDEPVPKLYSWDISDDTWQEEDCPHDLLADNSRAAFGPEGGLLLTGGINGGVDYTPCYYGENFTNDFDLPVYIPWSKLFASSTHLPSETATFTEIYDLGEGAGTVSAAVLNDRCVITEGINHPPLVWGGAMAADASDWMYPKQVLVTQDGINFYDISSQVLDKDVDNSADTGNIRTSGYIAVCCDVPDVEGFYVEMDTPNSTSSTEQHVFSVTSTFATSAAIERENYSTTGDTWTLGTTPAGTLTCSDAALRALITPGMVLVTADGESTIDTITYPNAELYDEIPTGAITDIYGLDVINSAVTVPFYGDTVFTTVADNSAYVDRYCSNRYFGNNGLSIIQVIPASAISASGDNIRITLKASNLDTSPWGYPATITNNGFIASHVSIVERSGTTINGTTTPTEITFNGASGVTIAKGATAVSDIIPFVYDETKDYLLKIDIPNGETQTYRMMSTQVVYAKYATQNFINAHSQAYAWKTYYASVTAASGDPAPVNWDLQNATAFNSTSNPLGFRGPYDYSCVGLHKLELVDTVPTAAGTFVGTTNDTTRIDVSYINEFDSVSVSETLQGSSKIYYAVSFDDQATWWVFKLSAWRQIVRENSGAWQYNNSATTTPSWQNAATDNKLSALRQAFGVSHNHMEGTALNALTSANWTATNGVVPGQTQYMEFAFCLVPDGSSRPFLNSISANIMSLGATTVEGLTSSGWTGGSGWTDGTEVGGASLGQTGIISYDGGTFSADYGTISDVPGFWYRFRSNGTSPDTSITRIMYQAKCQPLQNIGDGQPEIPIGFIYSDTSAGTQQDYTVIVSDYTQSDIYAAEFQMAADDYLYIGGTTKFHATDITMHKANSNAATLSAEYWNGSGWQPLTITDNTSASSKAFSTAGKIEWSIPDDWKASIPFNTFMSRGYWIRLKTSALMSATTAVAECRIYPVPNSLPKYRFAETFGNRIVLGNRPDAADQIDISRPLEEYGFNGALSASYRVGGQDGIQCVMSAWNSLWIGKTESWHRFSESATGFSSDIVEAARHIPINSRVIVKAPVSGGDDGSQYGVYYLNRYGAYLNTGMHTDSLFSTARNRVLSVAVDWWSERDESIPRLDLDNLHKAYGEYWPVENWVVWAVPMILQGETSQATNNRLIVWDLSLQAWLPPFTIPAASIFSAYHYNAEAPGKLGSLGLYIGDYQGQILRCFKPGVFTDVGTDIAAWIQTGWLHHGAPDVEKRLREFWLWGRTEGSNITATIGTKLWQRNSTVQTETLTKTIGDISGESLLGLGFEGGPDESGHFFRYRLDFTGKTDIYGLQLGFIPDRDYSAT